MIDAPLAFAFAAGLVAAFNPCGFVMLPAYLAFFLGVKEPGSTSSVRRAVGVGAAVSAGFVAIFAVAGILITRFALAVQAVAPWFTVVIGGALVPLGLAMLRGFEPSISLPKLQRGGQRRRPWSMFVFGMSYATVSLSCTLPVFLAAVSGVFDRGTFVSGVAVVGAYGTGMSLVLMTLTIAMGLARQGVVARMRRALPYVNRVSGGLLVLAGAYVAWYGVVEIRLASGASAGSGVVDLVGRWSAAVSGWVEAVGPARLGVVLTTLVLVALLVSTLLRLSRPDERSEGRRDTSEGSGTQAADAGAGVRRPSGS